MHIYGDYRQCTWNVIKRFVPLDYKEDQPRGISRSLPRRKTGLASNTKKSYIKSKSHCLIFYQSIVGGLYTIISEGKFTQSKRNADIEKKEEKRYNYMQKENGTEIKNRQNI